MNDKRRSSLNVMEFSLAQIDNTDDELDIESGFSALSDLKFAPTISTRTRLRLQSDESQDSHSSKAISAGCSDSGQYSMANASDSQLKPWSSLTNTLMVDNAIDADDKSLSEAMRDYGRLHSELERLSKSEKWYKQELRNQKHARLQALEKFHGNERIYMQENQRLQRECLRLYGRCGQMEQDLEKQRMKKEAVAKETQSSGEGAAGKEVWITSTLGNDNDRDVFENEQQRIIIADQLQLIELLRTQKRSLLADLKRLNEEKEAVICELEKKLAKLEAENQKISKKCKELQEERRALQGTLARLKRDLHHERQKQRKQEELMHNTQTALEAQRQELKGKEKEICEIRNHFKRALKEEVEPDIIHRMSMEYHREIIQKTNEIRALKMTVHALQQELESFESLKQQSEQQQKEIQQLTVALAEKDAELGELEECDIKKSSEIAKLRDEIFEYQSMSNTLTEQWHQQRMKNQDPEAHVKSMEAELRAASERYANMCALCDKTRFDLDMRENELGKVKFEKSREMEDAKELRDKLGYYLQQTERLSEKIIWLETELNERKEIKHKLEKESIASQDNIPKYPNARLTTLNEVISEDIIDWNNPAFGKDEVDGKIHEKLLEGGSCIKALIQHQETELPIYYDINKDNDRMIKKATKIKMDENFHQEHTTNDSFGDNLESKVKENSGIIYDYLEHDEDFHEFYLKLQQTNDYIKTLEEGNVALKGFVKQKLKKEHEKEIILVKDELIGFEDNIFNINISTEENERGDEYMKAHDFIKEKEYVGEDGEIEEVFKDCLNESIIPTENMHEEMEHEVFCSFRSSKGSDSNNSSILEHNVKEEETINKHFPQNRNNEGVGRKTPKYQEISVRSCSSPLIEETRINLNRILTKSPAGDCEDKDFKALNKKVEDMHAFIETLHEQNQLFVKQLEEVCINQTSQFKENQSLEMEILDLNLILENLVREKGELERQLVEMANLNKEKSKSYEEVAAELLTTKRQIKILQKKLLNNDASLYKLEKAKQRNEELKGHQKVLELEETNKELLKQLEVLQQQKHRLELQLDERMLQESNEQVLLEQNKNLQQKQIELENKIAELRNEKELKEGNNERLNLEEAKIQLCIGENASSSQELQYLQAKIKNLEEQLVEAQQNGNQHRTERIELLQKLLQQQNQRVSQLNDAQADWEELLSGLNAAQVQVSATTAALQKKQAEFDELNERFADQNLQLQKLHSINLKQDGILRKDLQEIQKTCILQTRALENQEKRIETLELDKKELKNFENLAESIQEEASDEKMKNELFLMQQELKTIHEERQDFIKRMKAMEEELQELRKAKRQAVILPTQAVIPPQHKPTKERINADNIKNQSFDNVYDHLRLLTKVLECEYKRKIQRYNKHIGTLIDDVKCLKHALVVEEKKVSSLQAQQKKADVAMQELELTKRLLHETRQRYEQSQTIVKCLQKQLKLLQEQQEITESDKSNVYSEAHEVSNLIDDYKKLIQHSAACSKRPRTNIILDLVESSNRNMPNFNKLESSIAELRHDIQRYIGVSHTCARDRNSNYFTMSLLDELQEAAAAKHIK